MTIGRRFGTADFDSFLAADVSLTRYNTVRSLRAMEGQFETRSFGRRTVAVRDLTREASYYNRVIGLDAETLPRLDEMIAWYHNEGRACHVSLTPERATPAVLERLAERGFGLVGMECFFAIHCDAIGPPTSDIEARRARREDMDAVYDLWETPDDPIDPEVRAMRREAHFASEFAIYLAFLDGEPVAMATAYLSHGVSWLGNANTFEQKERRGCHLALLQHRLWYGKQSGCVWTITDTDFDSISHRNAERVGMRMAFVSTDLALPTEGGA